MKRSVRQPIKIDSLEEYLSINLPEIKRPISLEQVGFVYNFGHIYPNSVPSLNMVSRIQPIKLLLATTASTY